MLEEFGAIPISPEIGPIVIGVDGGTIVLGALCKGKRLGHAGAFKIEQLPRLAVY